MLQARLLWEQEAAGSNPASPTNQFIVVEHEGRTQAALRDDWPKVVGIDPEDHLGFNCAGLRAPPVATVGCPNSAAALLREPGVRTL